MECTKLKCIIWWIFASDSCWEIKHHYFPRKVPYAPSQSIPTSPHCQRQPLFWCFSLSIMCVRFNVLLCITVLCCFVLLSNINCINTAPFIHSPVDGHLGCLQVLVIMNKSVNILMQVFVDICFRISYLNVWE